MGILWSNPHINIQPIEDFSQSTLDILCDIYRSTRENELDLTNWTENQKAAFVYAQFTAQHDYYQKVYPMGIYNLIRFDGQVAGRLYLNEHTDDLRIIDIALLPAHRNASIGTSILNDLQKYGAQKSKTLSIHVEQFNPAKNLYQRLGFEYAETYDQVYVLMKWKPKINLDGK